LTAGNKTLPQRQAEFLRYLKDTFKTREACTRPSDSRKLSKRSMQRKPIASGIYEITREMFFFLTHNLSA